MNFATEKKKKKEAKVKVGLTWNALTFFDYIEYNG